MCMYTQLVEWLVQSPWAFHIIINRARYTIAETIHCQWKGCMGKGNPGPGNFRWSAPNFSLVKRPSLLYMQMYSMLLVDQLLIPSSLPVIEIFGICQNHASLQIWRSWATNFNNIHFLHIKWWYISSPGVYLKQWTASPCQIMRSHKEDARYADLLTVTSSDS